MGEPPAAVAHPLPVADDRRDGSARPTRADLPPGPTAPAVIQFLRWGRRPSVFLDGCSRQYGDWFTVRFPASPPLVFFSDPQAVRDVVLGDPDTVRGGEAHAQLGALLGLHESLILLDGGPHLRRRRLLYPRLHGDHVRGYCHLIREVADREIATWPTGRPFGLHPRLQRISLEVMLRAILGVEDETILARLRDQLLQLISIVAGPWAILLLMSWFRRNGGPLTPWGRAAGHLAAIDDIVFREIARRRQPEAPRRTDVLSMLIESHDENGTALTDRELRDEMLTLLVAGHETTATSLAWACYHILRRPAVQRSVVTELSRVVGESTVEPEQLGDLVYLDAVIKETSRVSPVVTEMSRVVRSPTRAGGRTLPGGVIATPCIYLAHRRPDVWQRPGDFLPERFLGTRPSPFVFLPFGGGERRCIGAAFALTEMKIVLAQILRRVSLGLAPGYRMQPVRRSITLAPSGGVPVAVSAVRA